MDIPHSLPALTLLQSRQHNDRRFVFYDIVHNRFAHLQSSLSRDPSLIESTDAVGGTIIHIAYLFENYKIGRFLVQNFPEHALRGYSERSTVSGIDPEDMPYTGVRDRIIRIPTPEFQ